MNSPQTAASLSLDARKTAQTLGALGVLPFLVLAGLAAWDGPRWLEQALIVYAALILSFMAGILWAERIHGVRSSPRNKEALIASNGLVLTAWPSAWLPVTWACLWLAILFLVHLWMDAPWRTDSGPGWYRSMRLMISGVVIAILALGGLIGLGLSFGTGTNP